MWVADMDFAAPPGVTESLAAENRHAIHGYYADTGTWAAALSDVRDAEAKLARAIAAG